MATKFDNLTLQEALGLCDTATTFYAKDIKVLLSSMQGLKFMRPIVTNGVQVGDILKATGLGHPSIVFRVDGDEVYSIIMTTEEKCSANLSRCNSRLFSKSWFTTTISVISTSLAEDNVTAIYDNIGELKEVVKNIKTFYKTILKQKTKTKTKEVKDEPKNEPTEEEV